MGVYSTIPEGIIQESSVLFSWRVSVSMGLTSEHAAKLASRWYRRDSLSCKDPLLVTIHLGAGEVSI